MPSFTFVTPENVGAFQASPLNLPDSPTCWKDQLFPSSDKESKGQGGDATVPCKRPCGWQSWES